MLLSEMAERPAKAAGAPIAPRQAKDDTKLEGNVEETISNVINLNDR